MLKIYRTLLLIVVTLMLTACTSHPDTHDSHGNAIRMKDYLGKWVVINYWAKWCKPCLKEMPDLQALYQLHKNKVVVLGVSFDQLTNNELNTISQSMNITYPLVSTFPIANYGVRRLTVLPITFIINPKGKLVQTLQGPQTKQQFAKAVGINDE